MGMKVSARFEADGAAMNFDIGFIPDEIHLFRDLDGGTNELEYRWLRVLADAENDARYGIAFDASGVPAAAADADNGIIPYNEGEDNAVLLVSPSTGKLIRATVADWTSARSTAATARSITALGTVLRPTKHNGRVYECTTAGTSSGTEPTDAAWDVEIGETVSDNDVRFTARKEIMTKGGGQGFTIGTTISTDGEEWSFTAEQHDKYEDLGDVDGFDPVKFSEGRAAG